MLVIRGAYIRGGLYSGFYGILQVLKLTFAKIDKQGAPSKVQGVRKVTKN